MHVWNHRMRTFHSARNTKKHVCSKKMTFTCVSRQLKRVQKYVCEKKDNLNDEIQTTMCVSKPCVGGKHDVYVVIYSPCNMQYAHRCTLKQWKQWKTRPNAWNYDALNCIQMLRCIPWRMHPWQNRCNGVERHRIETTSTRKRYCRTRIHSVIWRLRWAYKGKGKSNFFFTLSLKKFQEICHNEDRHVKMNLEIAL